MPVSFIKESTKRSYFSGNHQIESELAYGWSHNYNLYAEVNSNTALGLGQRLPTDSTALMAASVPMLDLMTGDTDIKDWMTAALTGKWAMDRLTDNAVNLHLESDILTYTKQPDGSYSLPPGINAKLILDNGQYRLEDRFDRTIEFDRVPAKITETKEAILFKLKEPLSLLNKNEGIKNI